MHQCAPIPGFIALAFPDKMIVLRCIQRVRFLVPNSQHIAERARETIHEAKILFIHPAGNIRGYIYAALFHQRLDLFRKAGTQHIGHGANHHFVPGKIAGFIHHIHAVSAAHQGIMVGNHCFIILFIIAMAELRIRHGPGIFPVIYHGNFVFRRGAQGRRQLAQSLANSGNFFIRPVFHAVIMGNHRTMEFFRGTAALSELEILYRIGTMCHCLHALQHQRAGLAQPVDFLPVGSRRGRFHQHVGLVPAHAPHQIMPEGGKPHDLGIPCIPCPHGIIIPAGAIQMPAQFKIIDSGIIPHQIGSAGNIRRNALQGLDFPIIEIAELLGGKPLPGQIQPMAALFPDGGGAFNLIKGRIAMAPEGIPPGVIEGINIAVAFLQPRPEFFLTKRAMAFAAIFIGNMPHAKGRMIFVSFCQQGIDLSYLFPIYRRGQAMVMPRTKQKPAALPVHPEHFRVFFRHPGRARAAGGSQHSLDAVFRQHIHHFIQPFEVIFVFPGLQHGPGKNANRQGIDPCLHGIFHIHLPDRILFLDPLFGVVIAAVQKHRLVLHNRWVLRHEYHPFLLICPFRFIFYIIPILSLFPLRRIRPHPEWAGIPCQGTRAGKIPAFRHSLSHGNG